MKPTNGTATKILQGLTIAAVVGLVGWNSTTSYVNSRQIEQLNGKLAILTYQTEQNQELLKELTGASVGKSLYARDILEAAAGLQRVEKAIQALSEKLDSHMKGDKS